MPVTGGRNMQQAEMEIKQLKNLVWKTRRGLLALMPSDIVNLLDGHLSCESDDDAKRWRDDVIDVLVERAEHTAFVDPRRGDVRVWCPLCKEGSTGGSGFALPEGLRRHLEGSYQATRCFVMEVVLGLLYDHVHDPLRLGRRDSPEVLAKRRRTETRYRLAPGGGPLLYDEQMLGDQPRSADQLAWAEERLQALGFRCVDEGKTRGWVDETDDYVVYADPRATGCIRFKVWRKPLPSHPTIGPHVTCETGRFQLLDSWKQDLPGKYAERVAKALAG